MTYSVELRKSVQRNRMKQYRKFASSCSSGSFLAGCIIMIIGISSLFFFFHACSGAPHAKSGGGFGNIVFRDEFDGERVDLSKWYVMDKHERYWPDMPWRRNYRKENVYVENGALVLRTIRDNSKDSLSFSTGCVATYEDGKKTLFRHVYGRFEARVKFPSAQGHWCAIWLLPLTVGHEDGSGADGAEIDIMEKAWTGERIQHALHWDGYGEAHKSAYKGVTGMNLNDGRWHVIRLDWYPDEYVFYTDGIETWRTTDGGVSGAEAHIIISEEIGNAGMGSDAWGSGPIEDAVLPDYFMVDYVRVYEYLQLR
jgi:beta-glucanase (GH16 family)